MSRVGLSKLAVCDSPNGVADQLGLKMREHLAPLLANETVDQLVVDQILPLSRRYAPPPVRTYIQASDSYVQVPQDELQVPSD